MSQYHSAQGEKPIRKNPLIFANAGHIPFRLEVLTPVYVGSGEKLSPLDSVLQKGEAGTTWLHRIDLDAYIADHPDPATLIKEWDYGTLPRIWRSVQKMDAARYSVAKSLVTSQDVVSKIQDTLANGAETRKMLEIDAAMRNPLTHTLFIPGSSLKGAIRTVILDALDVVRHKAGIPTLKDEKFAKDATKALLGDISYNAMQELKVSDVNFDPTASLIVASKNCPRNPDKSGTPTPPCEALASRTLGHGAAAAYGRLALGVNTKGEASIHIPTCNVTWSLEQLAEKCNTFYEARFEAEWQKFYLLPHFAKARVALEPLREYVQSLNVRHNHRVLLLRVGHYSHIECVTVTHNKPDAKKGFGNTRPLHRSPCGK